MNTENITQIATAVSRSQEDIKALNQRRKESSNPIRDEFNKFLDNVKFSSKDCPKILFREILSSLKIKMLSICDIKQLSEAFEHLITKSKRAEKSNWSEIETNFLVSIIAYYCHFTPEDFRALSDKDWQYLEAIFPTKQVHQITKRWKTIIKSDLGQNPWTLKEDEQLKSLIAVFGTEKKWKQIAERMNSANNNVFRQPRQCRERWINYLDPSITKGDWSKEEDLKLMKSVLSMGKKWSDISKVFGNRTENTVRNRFNSLIKKEALEGECLGENLSHKDEEFETKIVNKLIERLSADHHKILQRPTGVNTLSIQKNNLLNQIFDKNLLNYKIHPQLHQNTLQNQVFCLPHQKNTNSFGFLNRPNQNFFNHSIFSHGTSFFDARRLEVPKIQPSLNIIAANQANLLPIESNIPIQSFKLANASSACLNFSKEVAKDESRVFFALVDINKNHIQLLNRVSTGNCSKFI